MKYTPRILLAMEQSRGFGRGQLRGITNYARSHGPWMFLTKHESYHGGSDSPPLEKGTLEGAIIREPRPRELRKLLNLGIPLVVSNHWTTHPPCPHVITDCQAVGQMGATHFLNSGFRRFAFCGTGDLFWSKRRCQSFVEALAKAGFGTHVYKPPARKKDRLWNREQPILADWLASLPKPLGLMACTDDRAFDVEEACEVAGIKVPEEVAILGVDNDELVCEMAPVPISSVGLNLEQAGYEAAGLLHRLMQGKIPDRQEILIRPTHITERRSTDILAVEDPVVAKAMRFINTHANQPLQVGDVAQDAGVSHRSLFDRFQKALGRTVFEEITRVRIGKVGWLLETTHLSTKEIAEIMGMPDERHLSRYFQGQKGMSPIAWRKQQARVQ